MIFVLGIPKTEQKYQKIQKTSLPLKKKMQKKTSPSTKKIRRIQIDVGCMIYRSPQICDIGINIKKVQVMKSCIVILSVLLLTFGQVQQCNDPNYIIPFETLDEIFDTGFTAVRSQQNLVTLIEQPNEDNVRNYILSLMPYAAPLFVFAGVTFLVFLGGLIQVLCFNTCGKDCCGNEINTSTYNVCCIRVMVYAFLFLTFVLMAMCIAALILNSDLQQAVDYTSCNTQNILYEAYNGNSNTSIPWSGVNNFDDDINQFAVNVFNVIPSLEQYFDSTDYDNIIDTSTTSTAFNLSQTYNCQNSSGITVTCPFADSSSCSSPYIPEFSLNFCNASIDGSAEELIQAEMADDSATWRTNIIVIKQKLSALDINQDTIDDLITQITNFTSAVTNYEQNLENGFTESENITYNIEIGFYVFYSFLLAGSLLSMTTVCCVYCCKNYNCNCMTYFWWIYYFIFGVLMFVAAGLFFSASIFTYDTCTSYPHYFENRTNFNSLSFASDQTGQIFQSCFFEDDQSIFAAFSNSSILTHFSTLREEYDLALPPTTFYSVVSTIENSLAYYAATPNTVVIADVNDTQQPEEALAQANLFSNAGASDTTQSCDVTYDKLVFNVIDCYPQQIDQAVGSEGCVVLSFSNATTIINGRETALDNSNCSSGSSEGDTYKANADALRQYQTKIIQIVDAIYTQEPDSNNRLQQYENNYFNYYTFVRNFFNSNVQAMFSSFFDPYDSLYDGSSCGFITTSMNGIVNTACNQLFPYVNAFSALNIAIAIDVFLVMVLAYFLTTRFQFYEALEGNFDNYGEETIETKDLPGYELDSGRQYQNHFITNSDR